ncbi:Pectin lyase-like superfamily protein [Perilla frutescens var. hirtella]|uniref:Pectin lyase-like superfamily protein n=1 Tax=Perilla frutescens var. hirtella TaxID=608512 RepID=A0AAD4NXB4_PERFH|nr:Pectin lyase-like superfamily protein [Perilla frutescens var. hirtella]
MINAVTFGVVNGRRVHFSAIAEINTNYNPLRVVFLLLLVLSNAAEYNGVCKSDWPLTPRPHSVSVTEFGAVGDGKALNTVAFQNAIFYLKSFADKGGAQLYVPAGKWLTGCITLTSHLTLFLEKDAVILGSQDYAHWDVIDPLPSYGRGLEVPGRRYRSLISGQNLTDVVVTGNNGTIDGQGSIWWEQLNNHSLNYSRPHLVEFLWSDNIVVSNLTFLNAPAWNIHPAYCSKLLVQNITAYAPPDSPNTSGIVPDSSENVCIENSNISMGYDAVVLKSGWDEYGINYNKPTTRVHVRRTRLQSSSGSGLAFGSEMSGGISNVLAEHLHVYDSVSGIELKTGKGRGGYIKDIFLSDIYVENVRQAIKATGQFTTHPDDGYDPNALPNVTDITFRDIVGLNITTAGIFSGIDESPFTSICLSNVSFSVSYDPSTSWICANVEGSSVDVSPEPCPELKTSSSSPSSDCFIFSHPNSQVAVL